jgi:iron complex outermembrane receptor protein
MSTCATTARPTSRRASAPIRGRGRNALYNPGLSPGRGARRASRPPDRKIRACEFFVENLTNQYYHITGFAVPEQTGNYAGYPGYPRFYGVRARFGF